MRQGTSTIIIGRRALLREGVAYLLRDSPYRVFKSAAHASDLKEVHVSDPHRILIILGVDGTNGNHEEAAANIRALRSAFSGCKIVIVAETSAPIDLERILALAPDGFILNLASRDILLKSLELTLLDQQVFVLGQPPSPSLMAELPDSDRPGAYHGRRSRNSTSSSSAHEPAFSQREREVLMCLAQGCSNKVIGRRCSITESTVKVHLKTILRKIGAQNRTQAAVWAVAHGFQSMPLEDPAVTQMGPALDPHETTSAALLSSLMKQSSS